MFKPIASALLLSLCLAMPANAQIPPKMRACGVASPNVVVNLKVSYGNLKYDRGNIKSIGGETQDALGVTKYRIAHKFRPVFENRNQKCLYLKEVQMEISVEDFSVIIDDTVRPGTCVYDRVYEHENQHVRILRETLKKEASQLKMDLVNRLGRVRPMSNSSTFPETYQEAATEMSDSADEIIAQIMLELNRKIEDEQRKIDTNRSYRALLKGCPDSEIKELK